VPPVQTRIEVYVTYFLSPTNITFAGTTLELPANTFKVAVYVADWPFQSVANSLRIVFGSTVEGGGPVGGCNVDSHNDDSDNLRWVTLNMNGVTMYSQLLEYALLDGIKRYVNYDLFQTTYISVEIPFFWYNLTLDPNFGFLFDTNDGCRIESGLAGTGKNWEYFLAIPLGVGVIGFLVGVVYYFHIRDWYRMKNREVEVDMDES